MPKITLEFDSIEDAEELNVALNGGKYLAALQELDNYLRGRLKYEDLPEEIDTALQLARDKLHEELNSYNLTLWG